MDLGMVLWSLSRPMHSRSVPCFSLVTMVCYFAGVLIILASLALLLARPAQQPDMLAAAITCAAVGAFFLMVAVINLFDLHDE